MKTHSLEQEQWLPIGQEEAWAFFSTPLNLHRITPAGLDFVIRSQGSDIPMHIGQRIRYTVKPLLGIPLEWETLITDVLPLHRFTDTQVNGPFALWEHSHLFEPKDKGTLMRDHLRYALPLGPLGDLAHRVVVRRKVLSIFAHRRKALETTFPFLSP